MAATRPRDRPRRPRPARQTGSSSRAVAGLGLAAPTLAACPLGQLTVEEETRLLKVAKSIIIKGVQSPERLLDETALFLHRVVGDLPPAKREMLRSLHQSDASLIGKKVLVVDDDVRNIFAISSILERHGMDVVTANNGQEAIEKVEADKGLAVVLMDIMMPGMDGYETIRRIRERDAWKKLPIIAVTAKAMTGDRERCIEAGANDYCAKPIDIDKLFELISMWATSSEHGSAE